MLLGRPIRQILLMRWVRLREALEDPIDSEDPHVTCGGMDLFQLFEARGVRPPPPPLTPAALLETMCREPTPDEPRPWPALE